MDTVRYEIDMLNFSYETLKKNQHKWRDMRDFRAYVECFLLHYRNLIEFFGNEGSGVRVRGLKDLHHHLTDAQVESMTELNLMQEYRGKISQRLGHMGTRRHKDDRDWNFKEMHKKILPLLSTFERLLPRPPGAWSLATVGPTSIESITTGTVQEIGPVVPCEFSFPTEESPETEDKQ